eukprot:TRINITY_DN2133_c0_g1_i12.p1 TRINITY_DN2133_c0_g1~~TRINITY_DN2133_c0_g1_i12.p1  ORF type:complete len:283 (+),score=58.78 TRINITY_DN2133_c0_g1_i12:134-982(+)
MCIRDRYQRRVRGTSASGHGRVTWAAGVSRCSSGTATQMRKCTSSHFHTEYCASHRTPRATPRCAWRHELMCLQMPEGSTDIHFTNGLVVWESAIQLSTYLTEEVTAGRLQLSGKRVLEIGSGPGLVGLVCAALGAEAVLSDYELPVLQLLDYNVRANRAVLQGQARAVKFDWNQPLEDEGMFDFVVATDVLASETNARLVSKVIRENVSSEATVVFLCNEELWSYHDELVEGLGSSFQVEELRGSRSDSGANAGRLLMMQRHSSGEVEVAPLTKVASTESY